MKRLSVVTTGGTIEKTYDEYTGELANRGSVVRRMLDELRLEGSRVDVVRVLSKDSLDLTEADRRQIVEAVASELRRADGVVVLHGTDTLCETGELVLAEIEALTGPVVLTGAMRPFEMKSSDALQNLTEALLSAGMLDPGVYCAAHGQVLAFPGVRKDRARGTFVKVG